MKAEWVETLIQKWLKSPDMAVRACGAELQSEYRQAQNDCDAILGKLGIKPKEVVVKGR